MLTDTDKTTLIEAPNKLLADYHARVMISEAPEALCQFYEQHGKSITGDVIVVRSESDEPTAAHARNTSAKVLFVFSDQYGLTNYFSGVCQRVPLSKAIVRRAAN